MESEGNTLAPEFGIELDGINYIVRFAVYAVIENKDRQNAIIKTCNGYFLPGGGIDSGESEVDALEREIIEEIGYHSSVLTEIGNAVEYIKAHSDEKHYKIYSRFYNVQLGSKVNDGTEKDHCLVWLSQEDVIKLLTRQGQVWAVQSMIKV